MTWLEDEARAILAEAEFATLPVPGAAGTFAFEDETVIGFVRVYSSTDELFANWRFDQEQLLTRFANYLRRAGKKAWNVYLVLFCEEAVATAKAAHELDEVEEDLQFTRKIARVGVAGPADVRVALYPLLPLQTQLRLTAEAFEDRLASRLRLELDEEVLAAFIGDTDEETLAQLLVEVSQ